jgi:vacuolar-type H+-ATPase subunit H
MPRSYGDAKIALQLTCEPEGVEVPDGDWKRIFAGRWKAILAVLAIGVTGVAWTGCGDGDETGSIQENIESGVTDAEDAVEEGVDEAQDAIDDADVPDEKELEEAREDAEEGLEKGGDEAREGIEEGADEAQQGIEDGKDEVQKGVDEAKDDTP